MKNIVIVGGSYGGIYTAHRILKQASKSGSLKITLVAPNTHLYINVASPRSIIPGQHTDDQIFLPIVEGFKQYTSSQFELIVAYAESLDVVTKKITVSHSTGGTIALEYDFLILATGSTPVGDTPFKDLGSTKATKDALHNFQEQVERAKSIVVAGAGVTGVEVAGELGHEYSNSKKIILVASGSMVVEEMPPSVIKYTSDKLRDLKVDIRYQTKILDSTPTPDGRHELTLSTGEKLITDMYISTFGLIPNSSYIPTRYLNAQGYVIVDEYLQVEGCKDVWAIGDVAALEPEQVLFVDKQSAHLAKNIIAILSNKTPLPYKKATRRLIGFQIGKKAGTGHYGGWRLPTFLIVWARKDLFLDYIRPMVDGTKA